MITSPENAHVALASGAADSATLLATHADAPPLSAIEIEFDHVDNRPRARCQLGPAITSRLAALVAWVDELDDASVTVRRFADYDPPFTSVSVHAATGGTAVQVWTHPEADEVAELWRAVGHEPESGVTAPFTVDALRAAAESFRAVGETDDQDMSAETSTETEGAA